MNLFSEEVGEEDYENKALLDVGAPSSRVLREVALIMKEATIQLFSNFHNHEEETLQYGCCTGNTEFKSELAKLLSKMLRNPVNSKDLFINTGSGQGVSNLLSYYFKPGDTVLIGDPTYWVMLDPLKDLGLHAVPVKVDEHGINLDDLEKCLTVLEARTVTERYPYRAVVYVVPTYQNPTTVCMSEDRCKGLVEVARKHDLLVVADDVYNLLTYSAKDSNDPTTAKPPERLFVYDKKTDPNYKGSVVSVGSFSKYLAPGLQLGWFEMPQKPVLAHFKQTLVGSVGQAPYLSGVVTVGLKNGAIEDHIRRIRCDYADKMKRVHEIITEEVGPLGIKCELPRGGVFMWILLPDHVTAEEVLEECGKDISFVNGKRCSLSGRYENGIRICISFYEEDVLYPAISKLCDYIKKTVKSRENNEI